MEGVRSSGGWTILFLFPGKRRKDDPPEVRRGERGRGPGRTAAHGELGRGLGLPLNPSGKLGVTPTSTALHPWATSACSLPFVGHVAGTLPTPKASVSLSQTHVPQSKPLPGACWTPCYLQA